MNEPVTVHQLALLAAQLPPADRKRFAQQILQELESEPQQGQQPRHRSWREIRGSVPHPLCGEDAQAWISRGRHEADEQRDQQLRGNG